MDCFNYFLCEKIIPAIPWSKTAYKGCAHSSDPCSDHSDLSLWVELGPKMIFRSPEIIIFRPTQIPNLQAPTEGELKFTLILFLEHRSDY